jgi:phage terminase small subunit
MNAPHDAESQRIVKSAWRLASRHPDVTDVDELMRLSRDIAKTFYLTPRRHRRCAELAVERGEETLALYLCLLDRGSVIDLS